MHLLIILDKQWTNKHQNKGDYHVKQQGWSLPQFTPRRAAVSGSASSGDEDGKWQKRGCEDRQSKSQRWLNFYPEQC